MEIWDLWYPEAGATGLPFARGRLDHTAVLWVHAAPPVLTVTVRDQDGRRVAEGSALTRTGERRPLTRLSRQSDTILREDCWPTDADIGTPVILPGGEVGILHAWWNADDGSEWRWQVEFYNHA
ncbi:MAG: hypothetical protein AB7K36_08485 [Chloroflexota bacterium]